MKKNLFGLLLAFVTGWTSVQAQEVLRSDTVVCEAEPTAQPTDDHYRVVTNRFWSNWFVLANVGGHAFLGDYSSDGKFTGLLSADFNVGVGKWFTPGIGAKLQFMIGNSRGYSEEETIYTYGDWLTNDDGDQYLKSKNKWWSLNASAMFNLSRLFCGYEGKDSKKLMNQFILSVGIGALHHYGIDDVESNEWSGHLELQYSRFFSRKKDFSLDVKAHAMLNQTNFDEIVHNPHHTWWDANLGLSIGCTYYFKKRHWDRCLPCENPIYINNVVAPVNVVESGCPEYGVMEFYVFFPNNYSGRDDAPTVSDARVNAIDYLAAGIYTQMKFDDSDAVASYLQANKSLAGLSTSAIPTEELISVSEMSGVNYGYEMSSSPISLSMNADSMNVFNEKVGYYYAPIYCGTNTWHYRVDNATAQQRLLGADNYKESQSFALNAHDGLELVRDNMSIDSDADLYSFADVYCAIEDNGINVSTSADPDAVSKLNEIFTKGRIFYVVAEGLATNQDNFTGEDAKSVGVERNKQLSFNRAYTVVNWLKGNAKFRSVSNNAFSVNSLSSPITNVDDDSVRGLNSKMGRCVKVRIHYAIDK